MMRKLVLLGVLIVVIIIANAQQAKKVSITAQKMGDGLYDMYAVNPNVYPMQLELYFTEFANMSASCELPYVATLKPGKHLLFNIQRTFTEIPGGFDYKYSTRIGAYPVTPDTEYVYQLPVIEGVNTEAIGFDFANSRTPDKISWGFKIEEGDDVLACRDGVVCMVNKVRFRDSIRLGDNNITILHADDTFGKYELFEDNSLQVEYGDTVKAGDVLGKVAVTKFTRIPHIRFSVYYVNARIDSINENKIRNIHTYIDPLFTDKSGKNFNLEADKKYTK